jgi:hypothetical protein
MPQRVQSYEELVSFLSDERAPLSQDRDAQVVKIPARSEPLDGFVYLRWEKNLPYIQVIVPMLLDVPEARAAEVIDALARVNHAIALPGFAYDHAKRFVYFRLTLALDAEGIRTDLLRRMILGAVANARDFILPMQAVVRGEPGARILELVIELERQRRGL